MARVISLCCSVINFSCSHGLAPLPAYLLTVLSVTQAIIALSIVTKVTLSPPARQQLESAKTLEVDSATWGHQLELVIGPYFALLLFFIYLS